MGLSPETGGALVAGGLVALLGGAIFLSGPRQYYVQSRTVDRAEPASGTIETASVQQAVAGTTSTYIPAVEYEYQTPTQRLHGESVYPGGRFAKRFDSESAAASVVDNYEPGGSTTVYYDPANPNHSFLEASYHRGPDLARIAFGVGLVALGVVVLSTFSTI